MDGIDVFRRFLFALRCHFSRVGRARDAARTKAFALLILFGLRWLDAIGFHRLVYGHRCLPLMRVGVVPLFQIDFLVRGLLLLLGRPLPRFLGLPGRAPVRSLPGIIVRLHLLMTRVPLKRLCAQTNDVHERTFSLLPKSLCVPGCAHGLPCQYKRRMATANAVH
jgi:hypothetical protein